MSAKAPQRAQGLREVCNGLCGIVRAGVFDAIVQDRRAVVRLA
jgi:hypothetical protein